MKQIITAVGPTKNYGLSPDEQEAEKRKKEEELRLKVAAEAAEKKLRNMTALAEMAAQYEEWVRPVERGCCPRWQIKTSAVSQISNGLVFNI